MSGETYGQIKQAFASIASHVEFDIAMAKRVRDFKLAFINKNSDHIDFFGGNLMGVQVVRFTPQDKDNFFTDVVGLNEFNLEDALYKVTVIKADRHVSGDIFNHTCIWMIHKFLQSNLNSTIKKEAVLDTALILYYRFLTSLTYRYFKYPADPEIAAATYAQLSNKFAIKQLGTWQAVLEDRCHKLTDENSIHYKALLQYEDDLKIIYIINDSQGRIRDMMKNIYSVFIEVHKKGTRIKTTSLLTEYEGEQVLRDKTKSLLVYTRYMHSIINDKYSFIKQEILDLLEKIVHTAPPRLVKDTLHWCINNYQHTSTKDVENLIDKTLVHSFAYLENNRNVAKENNDLTLLVSRLKGVYMSSRSTDPDLIEIRNIAEKIVKKATQTRTESSIASVRTTLLLYIVIRAFTMNYFSGS